MVQSILDNMKNNNHSLSDLELKLSEARTKQNENVEFAKEYFKETLAEGDAAYVNDIYTIFTSISGRIMSELDARNSMLETRDQKKISDAKLVVRNNERIYKKVMKDVKRGKSLDSLSKKIKEDYEAANKLVRENQKKVYNAENVNKYGLTVPIHIIAANNCALINMPYVSGKNGFVKELGDVVIGACREYNVQERGPYRLQIGESVDAEILKQKIISEFNSSKLSRAGIKLITKSEKLESEINVESVIEKDLKKIPEDLGKQEVNIEKSVVSEGKKQENIGNLLTVKEISETLGVDYKKVLGRISYYEELIKPYYVKTEGRTRYYHKKSIPVIRELFFSKEKTRSEKELDKGVFIYTPPKPNLNSRDTAKLENMIFNCNSNDEISRELGVERQVVNKWRRYYCDFNGRFIIQTLPDIESVKGVNLTQRKSFNTEGKNHVRENMILGAVDTIEGDGNGDVKIRYFGLEGANFGSYIDISELCRIDAPNSLVAENDIREYFAMRTIVRNSSLIKGGEIFKGLGLYYGDIRDALDYWRHKSKTFNLANLDFMGSINGPKLDTIEKLFKQKRLEDNSVLYITLNNHPLCLSRLEKGGPSLGKKYRKGFGTKDQANIVKDHIARFAESSSYRYKDLLCEVYKGINGTQMLYMSFKIDK